jgi:hypothetical protein
LLKDIAAANSYAILHLSRTDTPRGSLVRGLFKKRVALKFQNPQQGRYLSILGAIR